MKKSVIIVTALIYLVSIVVVAFLGFVAEIHNPPIYAEAIVMTIDDEESNFPEEPYTYYLNGGAVYDITYNPDADPEAEGIEKYTYRIVFRSVTAARYYYNNENELNLHLSPYSSLGECENQHLSYYIEKNRRDSFDVSQEGVVTFKEELAARDETIAVTTKDGTDITIYINIYW